MQKERYALVKERRVFSRAQKFILGVLAYKMLECGQPSEEVMWGLFADPLQEGLNVAFSLSSLTELVKLSEIHSIAAFPYLCAEVQAAIDHTK
jgi:hypothetical protein